MATNILHVLDVSTYFVLVYPWTKPVLVTKEDRCLPFLEPQVTWYLGTWFVQRFLFFSQWFLTGSVRGSVFCRSPDLSYMYIHFALFSFYKCGYIKNSQCDQLPVCLIAQLVEQCTIWIPFWPKFFFRLYFYIIMAISCGQQLHRVLVLGNLAICNSLSYMTHLLCTINCT